MGEQLSLHPPRTGRRLGAADKAHPRTPGASSTRWCGRALCAIAPRFPAGPPLVQFWRPSYTPSSVAKSDCARYGSNTRPRSCDS